MVINPSHMIRTCGNRWKIAVLGACVIGVCLVNVLKNYHQPPSDSRAEKHDQELNVLELNLIRIQDVQGPAPLDLFTLYAEPTDDSQTVIDVLSIITRVQERPEFAEKFQTCFSSVLRNRSTPIRYHIVSDLSSYSQIALNARKIAQEFPGTQVKVILYDVRDVAAALGNLVHVLRQHFSYKPGAYYHDALFFLSITLFKAFPGIDKLIMLDIDTKLLDNIHRLYAYFDKFPLDAILGAAYEQQPVYRHLFYDYRKHHLDTPVGSPPLYIIPKKAKSSLRTVTETDERKSSRTKNSYLPKTRMNIRGNNLTAPPFYSIDRYDDINNDVDYNLKDQEFKEKGNAANRNSLRQLKDRAVKEEKHGLRIGRPGFNSGVLLMRLDRMRTSSVYQESLSNETITKLTEKYRFRGHLGDQDFYTLLGMEYPELIYPLPCSWNRQLCQWWRIHGYHDVFDDYNRCEGDIHLYHGNCNMVLPAR